MLENGPSSRYASYFDVDWDGPESRLRNKVLLPILGDHYGRVLESGDIHLVRSGAGSSSTAPLRPRACRSTPDSWTASLAAGAAARSDELGRSLAAPSGACRHARATDPTASGSATGTRGCRAPARPLLDERAAWPRPSTKSDAGSTPTSTCSTPCSSARTTAWPTGAPPGGSSTTGASSTSTPSSACASRTSRSSPTLTPSCCGGCATACSTACASTTPTACATRRATSTRLRGPPRTRGSWSRRSSSPARSSGPWPVAGTTGYDFLNRVNGLFVDPQPRRR